MHRSCWSESWYVTVSALVFGARVLSAQSSPVAQPLVAVEAAPGSALTIRGSTTIGARWHCTARDITASATLDGAARTLQWTSVRYVSVVVPVANLHCQSAAMDRAMRNAMRADRDTESVIVGHFAAHSSRDGCEVTAAHLQGTLAVAGVQRPVTFDVTLRPSADDVASVQSTMPLTMSGFNIVRPRVLFGAVRARDAITVEVDLQFDRRPWDGSTVTLLQRVP